MFFAYVPIDKLFGALRALADCSFHNADHLNLVFEQSGNQDCPKAELRTLERNGEAPIEVLTKVSDELPDTLRLDHPGDECELTLFMLWDCPDYLRPEDVELFPSFDTDYGTLLVSECGLAVRLGKEYAEISWIESDEMETEIQGDSSLRRRIFKSLREAVPSAKILFHWLFDGEMDWYQITAQGVRQFSIPNRPHDFSTDFDIDEFVSSFELWSDIEYLSC